MNTLVDGRSWLKSLCGNVIRSHAGAVNVAVKLELSAARLLTASVTMDAVNQGWQKEGGRAYELIKVPHAVIAAFD